MTARWSWVGPRDEPRDGVSAGKAAPVPVTEEWRPIAGHPDYFVSNLGRVMSRKSGKPRVLRPMVKSNGYESYNLVTESGKRTRTVHPLVAEAFIGPRPPGLIVLHRDGNRRNNRVENLRWGTHAENLRDAIRHGTYRRTPRTPHCRQGHPWTEVNTYWYPNGDRRCRTCKAAAKRTAGAS